jgi:hypothetical protein
MASLPDGSGWVFALIAVSLLASCDRGATPSAASPASSSAPTGSAGASSSMTGITPHVEDIPASGKGIGPAEGSTAIGGVTGNQDSGGANKGGSPSPTGGDGASTAK